ncbi:TRAP transporter substrate-binding protein [Allopusillimonas soli]|uniref:TRAP transporter substrate-binding protein n=1 Tax=Allopusillimonas soli TaxID=659016 RepID=A0A853F8A8_9BURK|nr:TRAP transporter substrate-binding protein [Allopusillimonas soli]NYT36048.1 TRAP transporter substrate-binding protein [Allopusillimonas soli]TEA76389.1 TRAP transporter substrate-binding protein [Allopusillimonas soli]
MYRQLAATLIASATLGLAATSHAKNVTLTVSSWLPPTHAVVADFLVPWGKEIKQATDGRVTLRILPKPVTNPAGHFDAVRDGLVDISFISHAYYPGRFELTKFAVMPFSGDTAVSRSVAAWDTYEKYLLKADEHKGVRLLGMYAHGPGIVFTTEKPVKTIDDFQGLKIRVGGGMAADVAKAVGANPIAKPAPESYELLSMGVVDGVFFPAESLVSFKLDGVVKNATVFPGGLYSDTHAVIMNPDAFDRLSEEDQKILLKLSGRHIAELAGKAWDKHDAEGQAVMDSGKINVIKADSAFVQAVRERTKGFEKIWLDEAAAKGIDGPAALESFRTELKKLDAGT